MRSDGSTTFIDQMRRTQIIEAATEVIAAEGFAAASLARIARQVGISKGVITYHFGSKDALVRALLESVYTRAGEAIAKDVVDSDSHTGRFEAYIRSNVGFLEHDRRAVKVLVQILTSFRDAEGKLVYDESSMDAVIAPLASMLTDGQAAGEFRAFDPVVVARSVRAAIDAIAPQLAHHDDLDLPRYADELVELFRRAVVV